MAANSISVFDDIESTIAEINMYLSQPGKCVVVVEGSSDSACLYRLLEKNVELIESPYYGNVGVRKIIDEGYKYFANRCIGIIDRDYFDEPTIESIFCYDYCCLEMMIIANDDCFNSICLKLNKNTEKKHSNYSKSSKQAKDKEISKKEKCIDYQELRLYCLKKIELISRLRKLNKKNNYGISFENFSFGDLYNCDQIKMNASIVDRLKHKNIGREDIINEMKNTINTENYSSELKDLLEITNGHDFANIFKIISKKKGFSEMRDMEKCLYIAFDEECLKKTELYKKIIKYQKKYKLKIFK